MTSFAGSAIKQGKGQVSSYRGSNVQTRWLLLSGAFDPPDSTSISKRRSNRSGAFLHGITKDIDNMRECLKENGLQLDNMVLDIYLSKDDAKKHIQKFFERCKQKGQWPMLYYTGHGEVGTGNWCFADGILSLEEVLELLPSGNYYPHIFCDTCYSGRWANACANKEGGADCLAACPEYSMAIDNPGKLSSGNIFFPLDICTVFYSRLNKLSTWE